MVSVQVDHEWLSGGQGGQVKVFHSLDEVKRMYFPKLWEEGETRRVGAGVMLARKLGRQFKEALGHGKRTKKT